MAGTIRDWLRELGLEHYAEAFEANDIAPYLAVDLGEQDLKDLGVSSMGHRKLLLRAIASLPDASPDPADDHSLGPTDISVAASASDISSSTSSSPVERRLLTVLFCDLVGSTEMSQLLDPEDLREVIQLYQNTVSTAMSRYGGHVARFVGDGVLVYFGWPKAFEDQAERAVRAGLDAISALETLETDHGEPLRARIGIESGQVVVGDLISEGGRDAEAVTGVTPNLAARLQGVAGPGEIVIGEATRQLTGSTFILEDMGRRHLKGFSEPVSAWRVFGTDVVSNRFEAVRGEVLTQFIGRDHELGLLLERWELAQIGEGQTVLLSGEAGIGKSRLLDTFEGRIKDENVFRLSYQCSPYHLNSPLYPIISHLERAAKFAPDDDDETKLDKLEGLLAVASDNVTETAALVASLLLIDGQIRYGPLDMTPDERSNLTAEALLEQIFALSRKRPVLMILEDAHWIDPTTLYVISEAAQRTANSRVLIVITHRPEWSAPTRLKSTSTNIGLSKLSQRQAAKIVRAIIGRKVSDELVAKITAKTDGVPLYVEELTKDIDESKQGNSITTIPTSLQASLLARLDRLGETAKEIAQVGAVIGRDFPYSLLTAVTDGQVKNLDEALRRLLDAGLIHQLGATASRSFRFKHALVQDASYSSLLRQNRRDLHKRVALALETTKGGRVEDASEIVAHHYAEANIPEQAARNWQKAATRANSQSSYIEAIEFLERALAVLQGLPDDRHVNELALQIRLDMRPALGALGRYSEILPNITIAEGLAVLLGQTEQQVELITDKTHVLYHLGRLDEAIKNGNKARDLALAEKAPNLFLPACFNLGQAHFFVGDAGKALDAVRDHAARLQSDFRHARLGGTGTSACTWLGNICGAHAMLGNFEEGGSFGETACEIADETGLLFDIGISRTWLAFLYAWKGDAKAAVEILEPLLGELTDSSIHFTQVWALRVLGKSYRLLGRHDEAIKMLLSCRSQAESSDLRSMGTWAEVELIYALLRTGDVDGALSLIQVLLPRVKTEGFKSCELLLLRLHGLVLVASPGSDLQQAEALLIQSKEIAASFALRPDIAHAHHSLGDLMSVTNRFEEAVAEWTAAHDYYRRMQMTNYVAEVEAKLA